MEKEKKVYQAVWFWVLMGFIVFLIVGIVSIGEEAVEENEIKEEVEEIETLEYEPEYENMKAAYIEGCSPFGLNNEYCKCTWDYMYEKVGMDGIWLAVEESKKGKDPAILTHATIECMHLFNL